MHKVLAIAAREYRAAVQSKAFIISLVLMPVIWTGSIGLQRMLKKAEDRSVKKFAVIDRTPGQQLKPALEAALEFRNRVLLYDPETGEQDKPRYEITFIEPSADDHAAILQQRYELSQRVDKNDFEGFADIGPDAVAPGPPPKRGDADFDRREVRYQTGKPDSAIPRWVEQAVNEAIQQHRFAERHIPLAEIRALQQRVPVVSKGLTKRDTATGELRDASDESRIANIIIPIAMIVLMYVLILVGASPAMQGVVEEKQQRIAEVLLGSVTPFGLMLGKLLGVVGVALTVGGIYFTGGYLALRHYGLTDAVPMYLLAWFVVFLVLAVLMYASLFIAVGAAAGDIKETQALLMPVMILVALPMILLGAVVQDPNGPVATWVSFFPFSTPMMMMARIGVPPGVPWWQPVVGVVLVIATTLACVWAAGRIFRVGLLMTGKGVKFADLARWVVRG